MKVKATILFNIPSELNATKEEFIPFLAGELEGLVDDAFQEGVEVSVFVEEVKEQE